MHFPDRKSLSFQLVLSLVGLVLLTALIIGLPAIWLIRNHLEAQAWAQVDQGVQAAEALYAARKQDLKALATLTAQRPSLYALFRQGDPDALSAYLETLRQGADLDWLVLCSHDNRLVTQVAGDSIHIPSSSPCIVNDTEVTAFKELGSVWLLSGESMNPENESAAGTVIVGQRLDSSFVAQMRSQTGLDHTVLVDDVVAATTLGSHPSLPRSSVSEHGQPGPKYAFAWAGEPYYAERLILQASSDDGAPSIQAEVALAVAGVESTAQRLMRMLLGSIALASIVGFVLAVFLAHRISRPLGELANAANAMSRGDLAVSFTADGTVREVALVGKALNDARADLQFTVNELRREKAWTDHFLANVSHEFRTPLSAVAAAVELLMDQAPDLSPAESQELLTSLHLGVVNLQNFVDNLLESASIEAGRFQVHPRPCTLNDSIAEAVRIMQPLLSKHGQRLIVELPASLPMAKADPRRTVQVLVNLLSNANKYGPADAEIALSVSTSDGWIRLSVGDRGPGIPAGQRGDLFQRFATSTDGGDQRQVGFGLGLSVVKAIVEGHNGEVGVDDRPGGGAAFWFTLPVADEL